MSLAPGERFGAYEIVSLIGAGGMGEVYRARDTKLNRDVAVKILPDLLAGDPDRLARFRREAQIVASLNHPNIAHVYGLEDAPAAAGAAPVHALVMELVEGPTLADRIAEGPLAIGDALAIAAQVADALEAAHDQGIVHRDLKPANVKVRADGVVKVLDFGLAKMLDTGAVASGSSANLSMSPTLSVHATFSGMILGTAAYMSPEQARGRTVDRRTDVWAFGGVLFEMLTGARAFEGEDIAETIGAVIHKEPAWEKLPAATPATVRLVLRRCLEKDPKRRLRDIGDVQLALGGAFDTPATAIAPAPTRSTRRRVLAIAAGAALLGAAAAGVVTWRFLRDDRPTLHPVRFPMVGVSLFNTNPFFRQIAVSPDGTHIAWISASASGTQLMVRAVGELEAKPLPGADGAGFPFFSPDGRWIGYFVMAGNAPTSGAAGINKISIDGGPPAFICRYVGTPRGATWTSDDTIIFASNDTQTGLLSVAARGGEPTVLTRPDLAQGEQDHYLPSIAPDGRSVFFTIVGGAGPDSAQVAVFDLKSGARKTLLRGSSDASYVAPRTRGRSGYLAFASGGALRVAGFDLASLSVLGDPVTIVEHVMTMQTGAANFGVSREGTLAYVPGGAAAGAERTVTWVSRDGREEPLQLPARPYTFARLSPDETRIAVAIADQNSDVWIHELGRGPLTRLTSDPNIDDYPVWSPDGRRVFFRSNPAGRGQGLYSTAADGAGSVERVGDSASLAISFAPDGRTAVLQQIPVGTGGPDLMLLRLQPTLHVEPLLATPFADWNAEISPDGRWMAYYSNESSQPEVYVRPFPNVTAGRIQISVNGGMRPAWSKDGREIYYMDRANALMAVSVRTSEPFAAGKPAKLLDGPWYGIPVLRPYDVARDGRFLMIKGINDARQAPSTITVVVNWIEELNVRVPTKSF